MIPTIIAQHAEEAAFLWILRDAAVQAPHYNLADLANLDARLEAHLDGLRIAGETGWAFCEAELKRHEPGEVFAAAILALEAKDWAKLERVLAVARDVPETTRGLDSAFAWVPRKTLQGTVRDLLGSESGFLRRLGIAACALNRVDPGPRLAAALRDQDPALRARALRAVGELGRADLTPALDEQARDDNGACCFWAAWSAVRLGKRGDALEVLKSLPVSDSPFAERAMRLVARAMAPEVIRSWLKGLVRNPQGLRMAILGVGAHGDPSYVPWLIKQMATPELARAAGEAVALITGVDLAYQDLEGDWPEGFEAGPTENPEDEDVAMDRDEDLPWPAPELIQAWWSENQSQFQAGVRHLCGRPVTAEHCRAVLVTGFQRQRLAAALELALLEPGTPFFQTRAPGSRQQQALGLKGPGGR